MTVDLETLKTIVLESNPYAKKTGIQILAAKSGCVKLSLPRDLANYNPFGSTHAGALFTFGETACGSLIAVSLDLTKFQILAKSASIKYFKQVCDEITIEATMNPEKVEKTSKEIVEKGKLDVPVSVQMVDKEGDVTCEFTCVFYMRVAK